MGALCLGTYAQAPYAFVALGWWPKAGRLVVLNLSKCLLYIIFFIFHHIEFILYHIILANGENSNLYLEKQKGAIMKTF